MTEEHKKRNMSPRAIDPDGVYAVRGSTLLAILRTLDNEIPCRYIGAVEAVSRMVVSAEPIGEQRMGEDGQQTTVEE